MSNGSLRIVGTGIRLLTQATPETVSEMRRADELLFLATEPVFAAWIRRLRPDAQSLAGCCSPGRSRRQAYDEIVERMLQPVRRGLRVCAVFPGHPGFFVDPSHRAVRRARAEGFEAVMLPGISSADCLFAELGVDPGRGCQIYEATDFVMRRRLFDPGVALILLQIGAIGVEEFAEGPNLKGLELLAEVLQGHYPADHEVVLYEAASNTAVSSTVERVALGRLTRASIPRAATLYVPALAAASSSEEAADSGPGSEPGWV